ncbi:MAG: hypothetical protein SV760_03380, partial [Halobacteria archaeon]|nr:hypothetical protein [Halobacteria archaeon]
YSGAPPLPSGGSVINVSPGTYFYDGDTDSLDWNGATVNFNTGGGPITIVLDNSSNSDQFEVSNAVFKVNGKNPVKIYRGDINNDNSLGFDNVTFDVINNRTDLFQMFVAPADGNTGPKLDVRGGSLIYGVIYAPNND